MDNIKTGLKPLKRDSRDYSHAKTFGAMPVSQLPEEYLLVSTILDQGFSESCTAYASCAIQESQHGVKFDPQWFFGQEALVNGFVSETGYDMRVAMQTGINKGFMSLPSGDPNQYKEASYFSLVPPLFSSQDLFDSIRSAMWLAKDEKKCANLGTMWYSSWNATERGVVTSDTPLTNPIGLHDIKCAGWKTLNGEPHLVIQNSWGTGLGDNGLFYFPRSVVNKQFTQGAYMWRTPQDLNPDQIRTVGLILSLFVQILNAFKRFYGTISL